MQLQNASKNIADCVFILFFQVYRVDRKVVQIIDERGGREAVLWSC